MQRILELSTKSMRTGEARSKHDDQGGAWESAIGLNAFISDDAYRFLIATTKAPTQIGAAQITDVPIAYFRRPRDTQSKYLYIVGDTGRIYKVDTTNGTTTVIRPQSVLTALSNPAGGACSVIAGDEYAIIFTADTLVIWDYNEADDASHWDTTTTIDTAFSHPAHQLFDRVFFGNGGKLGSIPLDATDLASLKSGIVTSVLDFHTGVSGQMVSAVGDDGHYTIIALSNNVRDGDTTTAREVRLMWYSNVGPNWEWETTIVGERMVRAIIRNALGVFAVGEQTIYQIAFGSVPKLVRTFSSEDAITYNGVSSPWSAGRTALAAPFGDSMIFGKRGAVFGRRYPTEPVTFSHPLQGHTGDISLIAPDVKKSTVFVGTEDNKLWQYDMTQAGNTSTPYTTRWFDLQMRVGRMMVHTRMTVQGIEIELPEGLSADDEVTFQVETPDGQTATATASQATVNVRDRYYARIALKPHISGSKVRLTMTHTAGAPRLGDIALYGEPEAQ